MLAFVAGDVDMTSPYFLQVPVLNDIKAQAPQAICELVPTNVQRNVLINREALPFNKPELRRAVALTIDRKAFIDTLTQGKGDDRRRAAGAARGHLGHAGRVDAAAAGLRSRRRQEPRRGAQDHGEGGLRARATG